ncbi:MAG TPA: MFS transporter, partial [Sphingomicrobium sp.]|nr:MFS transporter [Sphingomicrobium sp.]
MNALLRSFATGAEAPRIEQQSEIDRLFRRNRIRVMLAITLGYGLIYMCRLAIGVVKKPLIDQGIFTPTELGTIGSALFYTYALGKLTNGFLADHANARRFLAAAFLLTAVCNIFMGFTTTVLAATIVWGLNCWFQSFGAPGGVVAMTAWFSNKERGRAYGVWSTAHSIGEGLTFLVVGGLVSYLGWQWGYWGPGLIGIITAIGVFALMQDRPQTLGLPSVNEWKKDQYTETSESSARSTLALQFSILKIPAIWVLALASATTYITRYGINSWGILYLQEARGYSLPMAG